MPNPDTLAIVKDLVVEHVALVHSVDKLVDDAVLSELGMDSMSAFNIMLDLEEEFDVQFPEELLTYETFRSPASLAEAIEMLSLDKVL